MPLASTGLGSRCHEPQGGLIFLLNNQLNRGDWTPVELFLEGVKLANPVDSMLAGPSQIPWG